MTPEEFDATIEAVERQMGAAADAQNFREASRLQKELASLKEQREAIVPAKSKPDITGHVKEAQKVRVQISMRKRRLRA